VKLLYMEVLLVSKNLAGPKTVRVTDHTKIVTVKLQRLEVIWSLHKAAVYGCYQVNNIISEELANSTIIMGPIKERVCIFIFALNTAYIQGDPLELR
jgi:hypothetical protein